MIIRTSGHGKDFTSVIFAFVARLFFQLKIFFDCVKGWLLLKHCFYPTGTYQ